jgi:hypothetical protein
VVRDYIQPLPPGLDADGVTDEATADHTPHSQRTQPD